jgi:hypothetical protein
MECCQYREILINWKLIVLMPWVTWMSVKKVHEYEYCNHNAKQFERQL